MSSLVDLNFTAMSALLHSLPIFDIWVEKPDQALTTDVPQEDNPTVRSLNKISMFQNLQSMIITD